MIMDHQPQEPQSNQPLKYKGLANIGATCYMNSLLQTLFMTPEFRNAIYKWNYSSNTHGKQEDSILYQLQVLFAKLQCDFPKEVEPKGLIRSFQWGGEEAFEQQDIQEFNRVLFEAIEQSLKMSEEGIKQYEFIGELFEGIMMNYTKCKQCSRQYHRQENFQDLILTVKDKFEKVYNKCLQVGVQRYIKPQVLSGSNQYFCEFCNQKRDAERGVKFIKLPKFLPIILRRFSFDLMTMERIKLNDEVTFPFIVNMNDYMHGYEGIDAKRDEVPYEEEYVMPQTKKPLVIKRSFLKASKKEVKLPNNIKNKPLPETKSFLKDMRKKTGKNNDITIEIETGNKMLSGEALEEQLIQAAICQSLGELNAEQCVNEEPIIPEEPVDPELLKLPSPVDLPLPIPSGIETEIGPPPDIKALHRSKSGEEKSTPLDQTQKRGQITLEQRKECDAALEQHEKINEQLKQRYFKSGPLVYELYSIMIHNGGVNHGHYYAYIKSFEDNRWYCFNDYTVKEANIQKITQESFGGKGSTNAYVLYYRLIEQESSERVALQPPSEIIQMMKKEKSTFVNKQMERKRDAEKYIKLKVYYQLFAKPFEIINSSTLVECLEMAKKQFGEQQFKDILPQNIRIRMYSPLNDTKLETYTGQEHLTLEQLKINSHKNMLIEVKKDEEVFDEYAVGESSVRISWWGVGITSLDESTLKTTKVSFPFNSTMKEIETKVREVSGTIDPICIIKRHQNDEYSYHQVVNMEPNNSKTMEELMIFENEILFVEPESQNLKWPIEFESEAYKVNIRYVIPKDFADTSFFTHIVDSRTLLGDLKKQLCDKHGLNISETIFKRGNKSGMELKDLEQTLQSYRFISGTQIYIENGIPALPDQLRIVLYLSKPTPLDTLNAFHTFDEVFEIPIDGNSKASECKQVFLKILQKKKGLKLDINKIRIRERLTERMTKIYRERPMKEQQLIQKRMIAIQEIPEVEDLNLKQHVVYIRAFDPSDWSLSDRFQLVVNKLTTMNEMAQLISEKYPVILAENLEITKVTALHKLSMLDMVQMEYCNLSKIELPVSIDPLFIVNDGTIFIVKDKTKKLRELTKEEQKVFGGNYKARTTKTSVYKPPQNKPERGVKITVKKMEKAQEKEVETGADKQITQGNVESVEKVEKVEEEKQKVGEEKGEGQKLDQEETKDTDA